MTDTEISSDKPKIFFDEVHPRYPKVTVDGKIDSYQFIEASRSLIKIYDLLGSAFYVVKQDMLGNVEKLTKVYKKCPEQYKFLNDMIYLEKSDPKIFAVDALLWLKRALQFISCFMRNFVLEWRSGSPKESVSHLVNDAYEKVLKKHHNWFVQNVFKMVLKAFPYRKDIVKLFYYGEEGPEAPVMDSIEVYLDELDSNLNVIMKFYDEWGLESSELTQTTDSEDS